MNESAYSNVKMIMKGNHLKGRLENQSSAKPISKDNIICLLQGASKLSILRLNGDYATITTVAITLTNGIQMEGEDAHWLALLDSIVGSITSRISPFWDWGQSLANSTDGQGIFMDSQAPRFAKAQLGADLTEGLWLMSIGLILHECKEFEKANVYFRIAMESCYANYENNHPTISVAAKDLALSYESLGLDSEKKQTLTGLLSGTGEYAQLDEECLERLAGSFDCEVLAFSSTGPVVIT